jgi:hypothetical protein
MFASGSGLSKGLERLVALVILARHLARERPHPRVQLFVQRGGYGGHH